MKMTIPSVLIVLTILLGLTATQTLAAHHATKETKMSLYLHDYSALNDPNVTALPVAGLAGKQWGFTQFGTVYINDDPITESPEQDAQVIGRCQGIYAMVSLDGLNAFGAVSLVFNSGPYNGSTLELQGNSRQFEPVRESAIIAGTGNFRYVRGYATFETFSVDMARAYTVIRCNVTVRHDSITEN